MIQFKQIEISDKKDIDAILADNDYRACDFCFTNLYAWNAQYKAVFAIVDETIFLRFTDVDGNPYYMMPVGKMPLNKALDLMKMDAAKNNVPYQMKKITTSMWDEIQKVMPNRFGYATDIDNNEYIYTSEKLIKLSGKKLQSKRNHINRFKADNPTWEYFSINNARDIADCHSMHDEWDRLNEHRIEKSFQYDSIATKIMLDNFDVLGLKGGGIRIDGNVVAFTIGVPLTKDTFVIHVEKAYSDINGAYTIVNQQFVEHEASEYTYINREEDMGIENLRKAKMSYYPDILLEEGVLMEVSDANIKKEETLFSPCCYDTFCI